MATSTPVNESGWHGSRDDRDPSEPAAHRPRGVLQPDHLGGHRRGRGRAARRGAQGAGRPTRLRLSSLIAAHGADGQACLCDPTDPVGLSQPAVSPPFEGAHGRRPDRPGTARQVGVLLPGAGRVGRHRGRPDRPRVSGHGGPARGTGTRLAGAAGSPGVGAAGRTVAARGGTPWRGQGGCASDLRRCSARPPWVQTGWYRGSARCWEDRRSSRPVRSDRSRGLTGRVGHARCRCGRG
jgi:hypothetical protein